MSVLVFTNGCFDLLHPGHIDLLERAKALGDRLVVGINSDESVRAIKGDGRPLVTQDDRAEVLRGLRSVDEVIIFDEPTPARLIEQIKPDVLVKGGDWPVEQIIGADFVQSNGGRVIALPLKGSYSTSEIIQSLQPKITSSPSNHTVTDKALDCAEKSLQEHQEVIAHLSGLGMEAVRRCARVLFDSLAAKGKILLCGNGGSASDAQHIAAEFVGRFEHERRGWPAIALSTDTSALTSISNDYGFDQVFARQVEALAQPCDVLVAISTSGNSPNVLAAVMAARGLGCMTIGLTGAGGKRLASLCDAAVLVPSTRTCRIQEAHSIIGHVWCELVDEWLAASTTTV